MCLVSNLLSTHELGQLLDEEMTENEKSELEAAELVCRNFLTWSLLGDDEERSTESVNCREKLANVLGKEAP